MIFVCDSLRQQEGNPKDKLITFIDQHNLEKC